MRASKPMPDSDRELARAVFDELNSGLIVLDREQRIVSWNAAFAAMCGIGADAASGQKLVSFQAGKRKGCGLRSLPRSTRALPAY